RAELEIPLGSGAKEMGIRPSIFMDVGAVWGVKRPALQSFPNGTFIPTRDASGAPLYTQVSADGLTSTTVTNAISTVDGTTANAALGSSIPPFIEEFVGNTWRPRLAVGIGFNWNSPFGPFRIDFAKTLLKRNGDDTKSFTFNVGTQF
ncbi:MAG: BamA/TamA family outer membrane protein, partial [Sphingomonadales bacterium]|nr:BamA/TamA family outer membrane protein [Sphingomonadales bacterium]